MQPAVHATTRTPGPSRVEPVVNEWRKPMSSVASAERTSVSGTSLPRLTRNSNGLLASSGVCEMVLMSAIVNSLLLLGSHRDVDDDDQSAYAIAPSPWKVRLITSSCCSRVSLTKFTA